MRVLRTGREARGEDIEHVFHAEFVEEVVEHLARVVAADEVLDEAEGLLLHGEFAVEGVGGGVCCVAVEVICLREFRRCGL